MRNFDPVAFGEQVGTFVREIVDPLRVRATAHGVEIAELTARIATLERSAQSTAELLEYLDRRIAELEPK